ncbi:hypothetical protein AB0O69_21520 [Streptomyces xiamenensis]|uniref:hypothetical protein n=1 Tax=Streptomyces xiamenensis TaxID=408015 RepID=UPI003414B599
MSPAIETTGLVKARLTGHEDQPAVAPGGPAYGGAQDLGGVVASDQQGISGHGASDDTQ